MDKKEELKAEIRRIENLLENRHSKHIRDELKQYLKLVKKQLKQAEKN